MFCYYLLFIMHDGCCQIHNNLWCFELSTKSFKICLHIYTSIRCRVNVTLLWSTNLPNNSYYLEIVIISLPCFDKIHGNTWKTYERYLNHTSCTHAEHVVWSTIKTWFTNTLERQTQVKHFYILGTCCV